MANAYAFEYTQPWIGQSIMGVPVETEVRTDPIAEELSGVEINQNATISGTLSLESDSIIWQTFRFPADYARGVSGGANIVIPKLCGFHLNIEVEENKGPGAGLDWWIDYYAPYKGWTGVVKGTEVGSPGDGPNIWFDVNFKPIDITNFWWHKFRVGVRGRTPEQKVLRELVPYSKKDNQVVIASEVIKVVPQISAAPLTEGGRYFFDFKGNASMLEMIGGDVYFTEQHGIKGVNYTAPNPFAESAATEYLKVGAQAAETDREFARIEEQIPFSVPRSEDSGVVTVPRVVGADIKAYEADGVTPLVETTGANAGAEISLRFRILSTAPDSDRDCTGSLYRTVALVSSPDAVESSMGDLEGAYWLSGPNPSQFACEALYFDVREDGEAQVIDHLMIDPVTPGVWMNIYYSNDPIPGETTEEWDGLLWTPIPKQFLLRRKESFALPAPIIAKYVKLEFTKLQPVWYSPGSFQKGTQYRKHPAWVYNYYFCLYEELRAATLEEASLVNVSYDALELAYQYYLDDIRQDEPYAPSTITSAEGVSLLSRAISKSEEEEQNLLDSETLARINLSMQRFRQQPAQQGSVVSLLQSIAGSTAPTGNYPTEQKVTTVANTSQVSSLERDNVIIEKQFPVTQFYLECRHYYSVHEAQFEEARAYFVGLKEVAFTREHYEVKYDNDLYIEVAGDDLNVEALDFSTEGHTWKTYSEVEIPSIATSTPEPRPGLEPSGELEPSNELEPE